MLIALLVLDGMRAFDVTSALEVFADERQDRGVPKNEVVAVSPTPAPLLEHGMRIDVGPIGAAEGAALVLVPGFTDPGAVTAPEHADAIDVAVEALGSLHAAGAQLASMCTGAFLLARTGLLDGAAATTHWRHLERLRAEHPAIRVDPAVLYTHDRERRVWTSAGVSAGIDVCLAILADVHGEGAAAAVARSLVLPGVRPGGQAQFVPPRYRPSEAGGAEFEPLRATVRDRLHEPWPLASLARAAGRSPRSLQRRFRAETGLTPGRWLIRERVRAAQELLERTVLPIELVATRVGFSSADLLRKHFAAEGVDAPSTYRRRFVRTGTSSPPDRAG